MGGGTSLYCDYDEEWQSINIVEVRRLHIESPTDVTTPHQYTGKLPIHYAVEHGATFDVVRTICKLNKDGLRLPEPHQKQIPLHFAAAKGWSHLVPYLLYEYPEGQTVKNLRGQTPLEIAQEYRYPEVIEQLTNTDATIKAYGKKELLLANAEKVRRTSQIIQAEENEEIQRLIAQHDKGEGGTLFICCGDTRDDMDVDGIEQRNAFNKAVEIDRLETENDKEEVVVEEEQKEIAQINDTEEKTNREGTDE